jgi:hypothetical protein
MGDYAGRVDAHRSITALATAAWMKLLAKSHEYQGAELAAASPDELERIRREAHDLLDANLDLNGQAARAVRAIIGL